VLKSKGKTSMVEEPSHIKQLSLNHVCKIGLKYFFSQQGRAVFAGTKSSSIILAE
jgi:hypothetical protein